MSASNSFEMKKKWIGLLSYPNWLQLQEKFFKKSLTQNKNFLFGLEHKKSITLGLRSFKNKEDNFLLPEEELRKQGIEIFYVLRGGQAALHSPGQLMIYPILNLNQLKLKLKDYIELLLDTTICFLDAHKIKAFKKKNEPGVFTKKGKMVFLGLRFHRGITSHGLALNVSNDLTLFSMIKNCGLEKTSFDSLNSHFIFKKNQDLFYDWCDLFLHHFQKTRHKTDCKK